MCSVTCQSDMSDTTHLTRGCDVFALLAAAMLEVGGFVGLANLGWLGLLYIYIYI